MNKVQVMESLSQILNKIYNAMDEVGDVEDNEIPKSKAEKYLIEAAMDVDTLIDQLDNDTYIEGQRSGAV